MKTDAPTRFPPITTAGNITLAAAVLCALTILFYAGGSWTIVLFGLLTDGVIAGLWLAAATGIGAALLRACRIPMNSPALHFTCAAASGLGLFAISVLLLGLVGWMNQVTAWSFIAIGGGLFLWRTIVHLRQPTLHPLTSWSWLWLLTMPGLGMAIVSAFLPPGLLWGAEEPNAYDVVSYHFQVPREWYELGRITPLEHNVFSFFPFNVEMHYSLAMHLRGGPWAGMYLAQLMHVIFVALTVVAVYGILSELGAKHATVGAVAMVSAPWMILLAPIGYSEGGLLLFGTLAIGLMLVASTSAAPMRMAALAGAMAGFACGSKLTAVPMVLLAVPLAILVTAFTWHGRPAHEHRRHAHATIGPLLASITVFIVLAFLTFSPWLIRNVAWTGNPVFPEATNVFSQAHFSDAQVERWRRAHSPRENQQTIVARLKAMRHQVVFDWRFGFALLPLAVLALALGYRSRELGYLLVMLIILSLIWLFFTHLQGRFFILAIPIAACMIGQVRDPRPAAIGAAFIALTMLVGLININHRLRANPQIFQALALERLTLLTPLADVSVPHDEHLALIGEARAFLYDVPTTRLHYRTVFDVDAREGKSSIEAWMPDAPEAPPGRTIVLIDPNELIRFSRTYWRIPPPPDEVAQSERIILQRR